MLNYQRVYQHPCNKFCVIQARENQCHLFSGTMRVCLRIGCCKLMLNRLFPREWLPQLRIYPISTHTYTYPIVNWRHAYFWWWNSYVWWFNLHVWQFEISPFDSSNSFFTHEKLWYVYIYGLYMDYTWNISGWWLTYPSEKYESVGNILPNIWKVIKFHGSKPPSRYGCCWITLL